MKQPFDADYNPTQEGVFDLPDETYFKIKACSNSALKHFRRSPAHVYAYENDPSLSEATPAMKEGTAFHWRMLQPELFEKCVIPSENSGHGTRTKKHREWRDLQEARGKIVLSTEKILLIEKMVVVALEKECIKPHMSSGWPERTLLWFDKEFQIWMKCKIDWIRADGQALIDLKKSQSASSFGFQRSIYRYDYYLQAYHYIRGYKHLAGLSQYDRIRWYWLVAEAEEPCESNIFLADQAAIDEAGDTVDEYYAQYARCLASGEWPGYPDQEIHLGYEYNPMEDSVF